MPLIELPIVMDAFCDMPFLPKQELQNDIDGKDDDEDNDEGF
jgi:hypothetical protein